MARIYAFEIKRSAKISKKDLKGLKEFAQDYPQAKLYCLFLGSHKEYHDGITVMPFQEALQELPQLIS